MKICESCKALPTNLLQSVRDNINSILEYRSQEIMKDSVKDTRLQQPINPNVLCDNKDCPAWDCGICSSYLGINCESKSAIAKSC
jgi:hypothetical protein